MKTTIKEVAKKAGVAVSTVSLVLNNKGYVSQEIKTKVLDAIKELQYHPQRTARGLVTRQSGNFGFIVTTDHFSQAEPFYTKIFLGCIEWLSLGKVIGGDNKTEITALPRYQSPR
jgi:LacI family transcriptional regulator